MPESDNYESVSEDIASKFKAIRKAEGLSARAASEATGIAFGTWRAVEQGQIPRFDQLIKLFKFPDFRKYALWFVLSSPCPRAGQIAPEGSGPAVPDDAFLDTDLMEVVIEAVETASQQHGIELPPDRKSKIFSLLYGQYWKQDDQEIDMSNVIQLIKIAA